MSYREYSNSNSSIMYVCMTFTFCSCTFEAIYWPVECGNVKDARRKTTIPEYRPFLQRDTCTGIIVMMSFSFRAFWNLSAFCDLRTIINTRSSCGSHGRIICPLIRQRQSLATPPVNMSLCPWARNWSCWRGTDLERNTYSIHSNYCASTLHGTVACSH